MRKKKILTFLSLWLPPILWALMIFKFSSGSIPKASPSFWVDFVIKKIGHVILFATLAVLTYRGLVGSGVNRKKAAILAVVISFLYGASDEFHQMYTQGREARSRDVMIDTAGAGLALFVIYKYISHFPKRLREILLKIGIQ